MFARCIKTAYPQNGRHRDKPMYVKGKVYTFQSPAVGYYADVFDAKYAATNEHGVGSLMGDDYFNEHFTVIDQPTMSDIIRVSEQLGLYEEDE